MSKFEKGDLIEVIPTPGNVYTVFQPPGSGAFTVRSGHLGIVLEAGTSPSAGIEYLEIYFHKRKKKGMILSAYVMLAKE